MKRNTLVKRKRVKIKETLKKKQENKSKTQSYYPSMTFVCIFLCTSA